MSATGFPIFALNSRLFASRSRRQTSRPMFICMSANCLRSCAYTWWRLPAWWTSIWRSRTRDAGSIKCTKWCFYVPRAEPLNFSSENQYAHIPGTVSIRCRRPYRRSGAMEIVSSIHATWEVSKLRRLPARESLSGFRGGPIGRGYRLVASSALRRATRRSSSHTWAATRLPRSYRVEKDVAPSLLCWFRSV